MTTQAFIGKKILETFLTLLLVTIMSFVLMRISPVDPAVAYAKRQSPIVTGEQVEEARALLGLNKPLYLQYGEWVVKGLKGDFGFSLRSGYPVRESLAKALPHTLTIVGISSVIIVFGVLILGVVNYFLRNSPFMILLKILYTILIATPPFYLAIIYLDFFALKLGLIRVVGNTGPMQYFVPSLCLSIFGVCLYSQLLGKSLELEMYEDYVSYARCRGLSEFRILCTYAMPHALLKIIPSMMQMLGFLMTGAAIVESTCSLPGLGNTLIESVIQRDSPMIHGEVLILALTFLVFNLLSDVLRRLFDEEIS